MDIRIVWINFENISYSLVNLRNIKHDKVKANSSGRNNRKCSKSKLWWKILKAKLWKANLKKKMWNFESDPFTEIERIFKRLKGKKLTRSPHKTQNMTGSKIHIWNNSLSLSAPKKTIDFHFIHFLRQKTNKSFLKIQNKWNYLNWREDKKK